MKFDTDVARLLDIVANALYTNRDVFLRELISNAADACDRLRYDALQKQELLGGDSDFHIRITADSEANTLTIADNGIGMNKDDLVANLGTIARSGTAAIMEQVKQSGGDLSLIGQFGVGFYACFMIAEKARVISRKAGENEIWVWESDGRTGYEVYTASEDDKKQLVSNRGTAIILSLKSNAYDFVLYEKIKQIILTYSDHVDVPVFVGQKKEEEKPVNAASALWTRPKTEITQEQYNEFYHHIGHVFDDPILTAHWKAEGKVEYTALLFVPSMRPWDLYDPSRKHAVRLYVKRVYITDQIDNLIYPWLRFVRGVIDSADLPLNISREMLQRNPVVDTIRRSVTKKILGDIHKLFENDAPAFETLWRQFGMVIKEGLYDAVEHRDDIFKVCRFASSLGAEKLISLDQYVEAMREGQEEIYYMSGENEGQISRSPQLEGFKSRGLPVLFMTDTVDEFWLQQVSDYKGKRFRSITKGAIDLSRFDAKQDEKENAAKETEKPDSFETFISFLKDILKDDIQDVRPSLRLTESPVCLVASDSGLDMHMESVLKIHQKYEGQSKPVLEINTNHALIKHLATLTGSDTAKDAAWLLLDQARIIQGQKLPDPAGFAKRMADFMQKGLAA